MTKIKIYIRRDCGRDRIFPAEGVEGDAVQKLTGRKTLYQSDIEALRALGFEFEQVQDPKGKTLTDLLQK